jgi:hypothetical protein
MSHKTTRPYRLVATEASGWWPVAVDRHIASYSTMRAALRGLRRRQWGGPPVLSIYYYGECMCSTAAPHTVREREAEVT